MTGVGEDAVGGTDFDQIAQMGIQNYLAAQTG